jgi:hypothetical protein
MFCGKQKLQLLITKRDPEIARVRHQNDPCARKWSVTIVRRESPPEGPGQVRHPYFKYLAPVGADNSPGKGSILSFQADDLPLMPEKNLPYKRSMRWGTCLKLYNYDMRGFKGYILRKGGLLGRLEILLPEVALPVRLHECREGYAGHKGSFDTNLVGLIERLESSRGNNLEPGYPDSLPLKPQGQPMTAKVYAFKGNRAESYRADQGIVFTVNGQTHGAIPKSFFERKSVKMDRLAKSLLVIVDCSHISVEARADLFKNSRDRLSGGELRKAIETELEGQIANHHGLRALKEERRRNEVAERLQDSRPLEDVLGSIMKSSPSLSKLFLLGQRLSRPYRVGPGGRGGGLGGPDPGNGEFRGHRHPTFFHFMKLRPCEPLKRTLELGRRCRVRFQTDVENEYFVRDLDRGRFDVEVIEGVLKGRDLTTSLALHNGIANWNVAIPDEDVAPGDRLAIQFSVSDDVLERPFINIAQFTVTRKAARPGTPGGRQRPAGRGTGGARGAGPRPGSSGSGKNETTAGIQLPEVKKVRKPQWDDHGFNEHSACTVLDDGTNDADDERSAYSFYINVDNLYLQTDIKSGSDDPALVEAKFIYGNVLVGLALIHAHRRNGVPPPSGSDGSSDDETDEVPIAKRVDYTTRALAPFMVPMIDYLGGLREADVAEFAGVGEED